MESKQIKTLMSKIVKGQPLEFSNSTYSLAEGNEALRVQLNELLNDRNHSKFKHNRELAFSLIGEVVDEVLPKRVSDALNEFADVKQVDFGDKVVFTQRTGRVRGRNFVTRVSPAGLYETFKLDSKVIDLPMKAVGGAVRIDLTEFLEGRIDFEELIQIIVEGMEDAVYKELLEALMSLKSDSVLPKNNIRSVDGWDAHQMSSLISISRAYGTPTIFTSEAFASQMLPNVAMATEAQKAEYASKGYLGTFMGAKIVVLNQSFWTTENTTKVGTLPLGMAWIIPTDLDKPVKVGLEGTMQTKEIEDDAWGVQQHFWKKMGVAVMANPGIAVYENTALNDWYEHKGARLKPAAESEITPTYTRLV